MDAEWFRAVSANSISYFYYGRRRICSRVGSICTFLTDLTRSAGITTWTCTRVVVDKVCARATILTGRGRTIVCICP